MDFLGETMNKILNTLTAKQLNIINVKNHKNKFWLWLRQPNLKSIWKVEYGFLKFQLYKNTFSVKFKLNIETLNFKWQYSYSQPVNNNRQTIITFYALENEQMK